MHAIKVATNHRRTYFSNSTVCTSNSASRMWEGQYGVVESPGPLWVLSSRIGCDSGYSSTKRKNQFIINDLWRGFWRSLRNSSNSSVSIGFRWGCHFFLPFVEELSAEIPTSALSPRHPIDRQYCCDAVGGQGGPGQREYGPRRRQRDG
jgi:hypothetical protein